MIAIKGRGEGQGRMASVPRKGLETLKQTCVWPVEDTHRPPHGCPGDCVPLCLCLCLRLSQGT